ncbi:phosphoglycerate dehydrogenase [Patescibacteria group bacterium]|nr:phosphoglycerate dehydrogenase [Patescibacteria group bacterium]
MCKVLITTVPFGDKDRSPLDKLEENKISYLINPLGKKLTEDELCTLVGDCEIIVAGTEPITDKVMSMAKKLKMISRVGIGLDSVDLLAAEKRGIAVSYTPDAPAPAVAELTIGLMYSLLRHTHESNIQLHHGTWHRFFGKRLVNCTIGIIGMGRIGMMTCKHLKALGVSKILCNDVDEKPIKGVEYVGKDEIYKKSDIISLHVPLTAQTKNMITKVEIDSMKRDVYLINTARGGIINEADLSNALEDCKIAGAAIDVFENEPYNGDLTNYDTCILTSHMGSMSIDCRTKMEIEATDEAVRFILGGLQDGAVPEEEYEVQREGL